MSQGQLGVLHTKSSYAPAMPGVPGGAIEDVKMDQLMGRISDLRAKENAFAKKFGFNNISDFIKNVREILNGNPNDLKALQQFSSTNLRNHLEQFRGRYGKALEGQKIHLTFKADNHSSEELQRILNSSGGSGGITWAMSNEAHFCLQWNTSAIKGIVNKMKHQQFKRSNDNITLLKNYITEQPDVFLKVVQGGNQVNIEEFLIQNSLNPFGLTQKNLTNIAKNNPQILNDLKNRIENFIYNELCKGASKEFFASVKEIMGQKIRKMTDLSFFMGGKGWITNAVGAFGELQTAILFQYIAHKTNNSLLARQITKIIGDNVNQYGQQYHTDLEILKEFGIQVKNYSGDINQRTKEVRTVTVNLHPSEVGALGASEGLVDYIINSYFNTSIPKIDGNVLDNFFKAHADELLNLDFNPQIPDQVCFYMIGGNFIPGSVLLGQAFISKKLEVNTSIHGNSAGNDEYFTPKTWQAPFIKWWRSTILPPKSGAFAPTENNTIYAWDGQVSISTKFTYSAIFEGKYKLF